MQKIILFYQFVPLTDPTMVTHWQRELCLRLSLKGRIIVADHGINGTLGGQLEDLKTYIRAMNRTTEFKNIDYKWSDGRREDFPRLSIKVRPELVTLAPEEAFDVSNRGTALSPSQWHQYLAAHPDAVVFDARNRHESAIGAFKNAIKPDIRTFKEVKSTVEQLPKNRPILTYCTGDVRCEYLSAYMKQRGFKDVYHLSGGIIRYGQQYGDDGYWEGKCYVFDRRMHVAFSAETQDIGRCQRCSERTSHYENCHNPACNQLMLLCDDCTSQAATCSAACRAVLD